MRRLIPMMLFVAACAPAGTDATTVDVTEGVEGAQQGSASAAGAGSSTDTTVSGRPVAPDFTLPLAGGGTYTLSDTDKPVYLIFWAEW